MSKPALPIWDPVPLCAQIRKDLEECLESIVKVADADVRQNAAALLASDGEIALARAQIGVDDLIRKLSSQRQIAKRLVLDARSNGKAKARRDAAKFQNTAETVTTEDIRPP